MALFTADQLVAHAVSPPPTQGGGTLLPMHAARKDGTPVLALLRSDLVTIRPDLERLHGRWVVVSNRGGVEEWGLAGPFGYGGLPDEWFVGWTSLPPASAAPQEEITRLRAELEQAREAPDGWKLVPVEPTSVPFVSVDARGNVFTLTQAQWSALLDAATRDVQPPAASPPASAALPEELTRLREKLSDFIDHVESKRDSAKAAATHYPSKAATVLGEADAYDDVAADLRAMLSASPSPEDTE